MIAARPDIRRGLIAKIHIARKQLALTEDNYRDLLTRLTGTDSCKHMTERQLELVLTEFRRYGFADAKPRRAGKRKMAAQPQAKMIRAMWLELRDKGQLTDSSESALAAFVKRMSGIDDLQWLTPSDADKVIKALRGWLRRVEEKS